MDAQICTHSFSEARSDFSIFNDNDRAIEFLKSRRYLPDAMIPYTFETQTFNLKCPFITTAVHL